MVGKIGQTIKWDFKDKKYNWLSEDLKGKTFEAKIEYINRPMKYYGVYAEYGIDLISFDECKVISGSQ